jgi:protein-L-isoaspartate O-methyltransferase
MIIPVGDQYETQYLMQVDKSIDGKINITRLFGVRYVPLVNPQNIN